MDEQIKPEDIKDGDYLKVFELGVNSYWVGDIRVKTGADGIRVVYNPNCCSVCLNSFGCIMDLDECLAMCHVEVIDVL